VRFPPKGSHKLIARDVTIRVIRIPNQLHLGNIKFVVEFMEVLEQKGFILDTKVRNP
jgi:hypothetical protein